MLTYKSILGTMILLLNATLSCQPQPDFRFDSDGALAYSIHGGYRKLPRLGFTRCDCN